MATFAITWGIWQQDAGFVEQFDRSGMPFESMPDKVSDNVVYLARIDASTLKSRT
ncbi:hypothetical protein O9992_15255 [Vibrio lentus]|nr:hypothetical protein [Vibrio lentus]